jgi:hypothetical protein
MTSSDILQDREHRIARVPHKVLATALIESIPKGEIGAGSRLPGQQTDFSLRIPFPSPVSKQAFRGFGLARCDTSILVLGGNACASTRTTKLVGFRPVESYINLT